jgi:hypothetical protein
MINGIKMLTFIVIMTFLFYFPSFASENKLQVFNTDHFTINLPIDMRQWTKSEMLSPENKNNFIYVFMESNKAKKKAILLMISLKKLNNMELNIPKEIVLKEIAKGFRDTAASNTDCRGGTSGLTETRIAGQKAYYFERRSENCVVTLEQYWTMINGNHAFGIYLARPGKSDDAVARSVINGIVKIKLK